MVTSQIGQCPMRIMRPRISLDANELVLLALYKTYRGDIASRESKMKKNTVTLPGQCSNIIKRFTHIYIGQLSHTFTLIYAFLMIVV